jgi:hypothetical protein
MKEAKMPNKSNPQKIENFEVTTVKDDDVLYFTFDKNEVGNERLTALVKSDSLAKFEVSADGLTIGIDVNQFVFNINPSMQMKLGKRIYLCTLDTKLGLISAKEVLRKSGSVFGAKA